LSSLWTALYIYTGTAKERATEVKRVDQNQSRIVKELRQMGYSVVSLADVGDGCPDILVGSLNTANRNWFFEIKNWKAKPSERRLTPKEKLFHATWRGQIAVIETTAEALKVMTAGRDD